MTRFSFCHEGNIYTHGPKVTATSQKCNPCFFCSKQVSRAHGMAMQAKSKNKSLEIWGCKHFVVLIHDSSCARAYSSLCTSMHACMVGMTGLWSAISPFVNGTNSNLKMRHSGLAGTNGTSRKPISETIQLLLILSLVPASPVNLDNTNGYLILCLLMPMRHWS